MEMPLNPWPSAQFILAQKAWESFTVVPFQTLSMLVALKLVWLPLAVMAEMVPPPQV
jgi:hypothetical protein